MPLLRSIARMAKMSFWIEPFPTMPTRQAAGAVASRLVEALPAHEWGSWNVVVYDDQGYTVDEVAFPEHGGAPPL